MILTWTMYVVSLSLCLRVSDADDLGCVWFVSLWCVCDVSRDLCMAVCIVGIVRIVSM